MRGTATAHPIREHYRTFGEKTRAGCCACLLGQTFLLAGVQAQLADDDYDHFAGAERLRCGKQECLSQEKEGGG
jgi:hypothetical protein